MGCLTGICVKCWDFDCQGKTCQTEYWTERHCDTVSWCWDTQRIYRNMKGLLLMDREAEHQWSPCVRLRKSQYSAGSASLQASPCKLRNSVLPVSPRSSTFKILPIQSTPTSTTTTPNYCSLTHFRALPIVLPAPTPVPPVICLKCTLNHVFHLLYKSCPETLIHTKSKNQTPYHPQQNWARPGPAPCPDFTLYCSRIPHSGASSSLFLEYDQLVVFSAGTHTSLPLSIWVSAHVSPLQERPFLTISKIHTTYSVLSPLPETTLFNSLAYLLVVCLSTGVWSLRL